MPSPAIPSVVRCLVLAVALAGLSACAVPPVATSVPRGPAAEAPGADRPQTVADFAAVAGRVAPVAESACRTEAPGRDCRFLILLDSTPDAAPNAYQSVSRGGRPVVVFTSELVAETRNRDELAFVLGHESAHHILGHLERTEANARYGAAILGSMAQAEGYDPRVVETAAEIGAEIGARTFSKDYELEADALGAAITYGAGYDPVRGAAYFDRIPDPGDQFLGTHPPNAQRMAVVRQVTDALR